jgi:hypothetical protein
MKLFATDVFTPTISLRTLTSRYLVPKCKVERTCGRAF